MKKISSIISVVTMVLLLNGCTNNEMLNNSSNVNEKISSSKTIDEKKEYYSDGRLSNVIKLQDGIEVERVSYFYDTENFGLLKITSKNNQKVLIELFYKNAKIASITPYINDKKNGISKFYDMTGKIINEYKYLDDNLIEEFGYEYYDSGELNYKRPIKGKNVEGLVTKYFKNGRIETQAYLTNGLLNGEFREYYENGNLKQTNYYINGKINGIEKKYFENGTLNWEVNIVNDKPEGTYKEYNGNTNKIFNFVSGKREGKQYIYTYSKLSHESNYKNGKQEGIQKTFYYTGNLNWEALYKNDVIQSSKHYLENGNLDMEIIFKDGKAYSGYIYDYDGKKTKMTNAHFNNLGLEY